MLRAYLRTGLAVLGFSLATAAQGPSESTTVPVEAVDRAIGHLTRLADQAGSVREWVTGFELVGAVSTTDSDYLARLGALEAAGESRAVRSDRLVAWNRGAFAALERGPAPPPGSGTVLHSLQYWAGSAGVRIDLKAGTARTLAKHLGAPHVPWAYEFAGFIGGLPLSALCIHARRAGALQVLESERYRLLIRVPYLPRLDESARQRVPERARQFVHLGLDLDPPRLQEVSFVVGRDRPVNSFRVLAWGESGGRLYPSKAQYDVYAQSKPLVPSLDGPPCVRWNLVFTPV